jgi:hypothetical protein
MITYARINTILNAVFALVWLINGLYCKVLGFVPRHRMIVARILGNDYADIATKAIGVLEMCMVIWVLSSVKSRWCAITQITVVALMNIIEFIMVPDLLLFGRLNIVVAIIFVGIIYSNAFVFNAAKLPQRA